MLCHVRCSDCPRTLARERRGGRGDWKGGVGAVASSGHSEERSIVVPGWLSSEAGGSHSLSLAVEGAAAVDGVDEDEILAFLLDCFFLFSFCQRQSALV